MKATDNRMNITSRTFDMIKIIKLYSWERIFKKKNKSKKRNRIRYKQKKIRYTSICKYNILDGRAYSLYDMYYIL